MTSTMLSHAHLYYSTIIQCYNTTLYMSQSSSSAFMDGVNCSELNKTCFKFSRHEFTSLFWTAIGVSTLAAIVCLLAILIIALFKAYKNFVHRCSLYLIITALACSISSVLRSAPVGNLCGYVVVRNEQLCKAAGFLTEYSVWMMLLCMCWITLYLFILAVFKRKYSSKKCEVGLLIVCLIVPLLFSIVPFIDFQNGTMYGLAGPWCWIKITNGTCHEYEEGVIEQFTLFYGPLIFIFTLNFLAMLVVIIVLYRGTRKQSGRLQNQYKEAMKEAMPLLIYPIVYNILVSLGFINRVYYATVKKANFSLWETQATAYPLLSLLIPLAYILRPQTLKLLKKLGKKRHPRSQLSQTHFVVSREDIGDTSVERLVIVGHPREQSSGYDSFDITPKVTD